MQCTDPPTYTVSPIDLIQSGWSLIYCTAPTAYSNFSISHRDSHHLHSLAHLLACKDVSNACISSPRYFFPIHFHHFSFLDLKFLKLEKMIPHNISLFNKSLHCMLCTCDGLSYIWLHLRGKKSDEWGVAVIIVPSLPVSENVSTVYLEGNKCKSSLELLF